MRLALIAAIFMGCAKSTPPVGPEGGEASPKLPFDPDVATGTLPNGLDWYVEPNTYPEGRVEVRLVVKAGSVLEEDDQRGGAHYIEHMAFNGSDHFPGNEMVKWLESTGASFGAHTNAYTSFDETVYQLSLSTAEEGTFDKGLLALRDWAGGLTFDPEEFESERGVVIEEWRRSQGSTSRMLERVLPVLFHESRYGERKPIGTEASLRDMKLEALQRFYRDWYRPSLMSVIVVGDIDGEQARARIEDLFGDLADPETAPERVSHPVPDHESLFVLYVEPEQPIANVGVQAKVDWINGDDETWLHSYFVGRIGDWIMSRRMAALNTDPALAVLQAPLSSQRLSPTRGLNVLTVVPKGDRLLEAYEDALTEVRRATQHGFTASELAKAKEVELVVWDARYRERENTHSSAEVGELVDYVLRGEFKAGQEWEYAAAQRLVPTVSLEDLQEWITSYLPEESRIYSAVVPQGTTLPSEEDLVAIAARVATADVDAHVASDLDQPLVESPQPGSIVERSRVEALNLVRWDLSNGAVVWLKPTDFKDDEISIYGRALGGDSVASDDDYFSAGMASGLQRASGAGPYDRTELATYLASHRASMSLWTSTHENGITGSTSPDDLELALKLMYLGFTNPRFDQDTLDVLKPTIIEMEQRKHEDPDRMFSELVSEMQYGDHLRARPITPEDVEKINVETMHEFFGQMTEDASDYEFTLVGAFDPAEIEGLVTTWIASLPSKDTDKTWIDREMIERVGAERRDLRMGDEPRAKVSMWITGDWEYDHEQNHRFETFGSAIETVLREQLREELSGTYTVNVSTSLNRIPKGKYRLQVSFGCEPARVDELVAATLATLDTATRDPIDQRVITGVIEQQRASHSTALQSNGAWTNRINRYRRAGWDLEGILDLEDLLAGDTPDALKGVAEKVINVDAFKVATLLPAAPE